MSQTPREKAKEILLSLKKSVEEDGQDGRPPKSPEAYARLLAGLTKIVDEMKEVTHVDDH